MSLTLKTTTGILWNVAELISKKGLQVVVTLLLAYFLTPEDFGLIAMLAVFLAIGNQLMESGFQQALIRLKTLTQTDLATAFYSNILLGCFAYFLLFITAPYISDFYGEPKLTELIRIVGFSIIFSSFKVVQVASLSRKLDFKSQLKVNLPASIISGVFAVTLAYLNFGVWSLVVQMLLVSFLTSLFFWLLNAWRPSFEFSLESFKGMYFFGYKLFLSGLIDTIFKNLYVIVIAKSFSFSVAGLYFFADRVKELVVMQLVSAIQRVTYPALALKKDDKAKLKESYRKLVKVISFILFPVFLFFAVLSQLIFESILPIKWQDSATYLQLMLIASLLIPLHAINLNILTVLGRSDLFLYLEVLKKSLLALTLFFSIEYGVIGILYGQIVLSLISYFINVYFAGGLIKYSTWEQICDFIPSLMLAGIISVIIFYLELRLEWNHLLELLVLGASSISLYVASAFILKFDAYMVVKELLLQQLRKNKKLS